MTPRPTCGRLRRAAALSLLAAALFWSGCGGTLTEQKAGVADFDRGKAAYDRGDWYDAIADLKAYVEQFPGTERTDDALHYLGEAYMRNKEYALASGQFDRLLRDFPQSPFAPEALFLLARCDDLTSRPAPLDQTETLRAIDRYHQFLDAYPEHPRAAEARERLKALRDRLAEKRFRNGRLYAKLRAYAAAEFYLDGVVTQYSDSKWAGDAALLLSEVYLKQGKRQEALAALRRIPQNVATAEVLRRASERLKVLGDAGEPR